LGEASRRPKRDAGHAASGARRLRRAAGFAAASDNRSDRPKFLADTQIAETTLAGTSGVLVHTYTFEVDHDFRRWLTGIGKFSYGTLDYKGDGKRDKTYSLSGDLIYRMNRNFWLKGTLCRDVLDSNVAGSSSASTVAMLGMRVQN
jgi:hypothetical protein